MRLKKFTAIAAASVCAFGLASGVAQAVPRPIKTDSSGVVTGSYSITSMRQWVLIALLPR